MWRYEKGWNGHMNNKWGWDFEFTLLYIQHIIKNCNTKNKYIYYNDYWLIEDVYLYNSTSNAHIITTCTYQ